MWDENETVDAKSSRRIGEAIVRIARGGMQPVGSFEKLLFKGLFPGPTEEEREQAEAEAREREAADRERKAAAKAAAKRAEERERREAEKREKQEIEKRQLEQLSRDIKDMARGLEAFAAGVRVGRRG